MSTSITIQEITPLAENTTVTVTTGLKLLYKITDMYDVPTYTSNKYLKSNSDGTSTEWVNLSDDPTIQSQQSDINNNTSRLDDIDWKRYAPSEAEFKALQEKRIRDSAGSGSSEWGKHELAEAVNQGLYGSTTDANVIHLGGDSQGTSRTDYAVVLINGVQHKVAFVNSANERCNISTPAAENGTRTYDSATGVVIQHVDSAAAFAAETATNKVILSRQDYIFIESFHELVSEKDVHLPLGSPQYGATTDEDGISLSLLTGLGIGQGYSAFGEWDSATVGYGKTFSTMSDAEKKSALANPDNNYYINKDGDLVQVRYKALTYLGSGDFEYSISSEGFARSDSDVTLWKNADGRLRVKLLYIERGNQGVYHPTYNTEGFNVDTSGKKWRESGSVSINSTLECFTKASPSNGRIGSTSGRDDQYKYYDAVYAGKVHDLRLPANKKDYNRLLEDGIRKAESGETRGKGKLVHSTVYDDAGTGSNGNAANKWRYTGSGEIMYVYADFTNKDVSVGDWCYMYDATDNIIIRFLVEILSDGQLIQCASGQNIEIVKGTVNSGDNGAGNEVYYILEKELTAEYDSLPWVDIFGDPERILATFPDGCVGRWIPQIPDGGIISVDLNHKANQNSIKFPYTLSDGASWLTLTESVDSITNSMTRSFSATVVALFYYESLSDFTKSDSNLGVVGEIGDVTVTKDATIHKGNRLAPSLCGVICKSSADLDNHKRVSVISSTLVGGKLGSEHNTHVPINIKAPTNNSDAVKAQYHLVEKDGLLYLQYHGNQMIYDDTNTNWGDVVAGTSITLPYGTIPIVDNESTKTDLNGNTVKTFTHSEMIPIGISHNN